MTEKNRVKLNYNIGNAINTISIKQAGKLALHILLLMLIFLIFGSLLIFENKILSSIVNIAFISLCCFSFYNSGIQLGQKEAHSSEIIFKKSLSEDISNSEKATCYIWYKGIFIVILGMLPYLIICIIFAITTNSQNIATSSAMAVENMLSSGNEAIVNTSLNFGSIDALRIFCRILIMPFISIATSFSESYNYWLEKLCPIIALFIPSFYAYGYYMGKKYRQNIHKRIMINEKIRQEKGKLNNENNSRAR